MRSTAWLAAAILGAGILLGCRTVWVHPKATAEKYQTDFARCKYGMTPAELERIMDDPHKDFPPQRRDWKRCMQLLGWHTKVGSRSHRAWDTP